MIPYYYDRALKIPIYNIYHIRRIKAICSFIPKNIEILVDIGCNSGTLTEFMKKTSGAKRVIGFDIDKNCIEYARKKRPNIEFYVRDGRKLDILPKNFADVVTLIEVLEHVEDPINLLKEAKRILKKGGYIIIVIPNENSILFKIIWFIWTKTFGKIWKDAHLSELDEKKSIQLLNNLNLKILKIIKLNFGMLILLFAKKLDTNICN